MTDKTEDKLEEDAVSGTTEKCGIIMPIASMDGYPESHWKDVRRILASAIEDAGFEAKIVSESDDIGVIHKRIVQNLYDNPMIVCDISGRNANVMFELGLRLAFDKPTIIVKDDATPYSFDTSVIEHLAYPKDLRYQKIESFKLELTERIEKTYATYLKDTDEYSTFLKNFGSFTVPKLDEKTVPVNEYIVQELKSIREDINQIKLRDRLPSIVKAKGIVPEGFVPPPPTQDIHISFFYPEQAKMARFRFNLLGNVLSANISNENELKVKFNRSMHIHEIESLFKSFDIRVDSYKTVDGVLHFVTDIPF
ncbi:hypothetical protein ACTXJ2_01970 [Psychrobacter alimentarius]|uniref:hypothetical protein n=1 Tax=Psychrobacter alimentarius TaxID=261164 RepID=UPI003FBA202C